MALGTQHNAFCYGTQLDAARSWCSSYGGLTSNGTTYSCDGIVSGADAVLGGDVIFKWTRRTVDSAGVATTAPITGQKLPGCETFGWDYYEPYVAAWVAAMVAVVAVKAVWRFIFARESL